ncbi:MAG: TIGR00730 family Rossman fold protein [Betaproteobacteria bacterium]|nr:TIGR00730 family Rossman fold protein [Betaproteobacteria bacterium]
MREPAFSICVYCGSKPGDQDIYTQCAQQVGQWIGQHGGQLVYGGGRNGLMGTVADATLAAGGRVVGIIPQALVEKEWSHTECTELHVVQTMHERKQMMAERADAFLSVVTRNFMTPWQMELVQVHDQALHLLPHLVQAAGLPTPFQSQAV